MCPVAKIIVLVNAPLCVFKSLVSDANRLNSLMIVDEDLIVSFYLILKFFFYKFDLRTQEINSEK